MKPITSYAVATIDEDSDRCTLNCNGRALPGNFAGATLEAQFAPADGESLLILSDANPYDGRLYVYLLDPESEVIDALEGGGAFQPGLFRLGNVATTSFRFEFFTNDLMYEISVAAQAEIHFTTPAGWRYERKLKWHRLTINIVKN